MMAMACIRQPALAADKASSEETQAMRPLAQDYVTVFESPKPEDVYVVAPGIARTPAGRLVVTTGAREGREAGNAWIRSMGWVDSKDRLLRGMIFTSDDHGATWTMRARFPFTQARPFVAGKSLYVIGQGTDLMIMRSQNWGDTWSEPALLTQGQRWHQAPSNVHYENGNVYLVMERQMYEMSEAGRASTLAPVLMRARVGDDLTQVKNWTFASELAFRDAVPESELNYFGVPRFPVDSARRNTEKRLPGYHQYPTGWGETQVVRFTDPDHLLYDPEQRTLHLIMRAFSAGTNFSAWAKVVENPDGSMTTMLEKAPSGRYMTFVPLPGGHLKFYILYDDVSKLYWLASSQAVDTTRRSNEKHERNRLQLHFSKNCIDWAFAGLVAIGASPEQSRHYAAMAIDGENLLIVSRSGNEKSETFHNTNVVTFHTIRNFRRLVY